MTSVSVLRNAEKAIPAEVRMISGCQDAQTSADVSNVTSFRLPDPAGRAGGACTSALLNILYADHKRLQEDLSFQQVLLKMRDMLGGGGFTQIPQLTSSRPFDIQETFDLVPPGFPGTRRAVLIGINYVGMQGELSGCHNDAKNMKEYIMDVHGFKEENITMLLDDGVHKDPTRANILNAYKELAAKSEAGDACFCHYSGHGGKLRDDNGDEADGYDETLIPLDYRSSGQIRDDDLFNALIGPMPCGVTLTCVMDCCHSGTVLDLPFHFKADGTENELVATPDFDFGPLLQLASALLAGQQLENADTMTKYVTQIITLLNDMAKDKFGVDLKESCTIL